jgi:hypothetical protein
VYSVSPAEINPRSDSRYPRETPPGVLAGKRRGLLGSCKYTIESERNEPPGPLTRAMSVRVRRRRVTFAAASDICTDRHLEDGDHETTIDFDHDA